MIVDDHPIIRAGLKAILNPYSDLDIVAEASTGEQAQELALEHEPDVILMDLNLGEGISGMDTIRAILMKAGRDKPGILVLTSMETEVNILDAMEVGALGYLLKDAHPDTLAQAIRAASDGQAYLDQAVTRTLVAHASRPSAQNLTLREREIIQLVAAGHSNSDIASIAFIEEATVKAHLTRVFNKLDANSRTAAVAKARVLGIIQ